MRVMALDWGTRRIGIAVSDELGIAAHGLPTLERRNIQRDLDALTGVIRDRGIETVVVGNPLHLDGTESTSSKHASRFARRLAKHAGVSVRLWDERLTSWTAEELIPASSRDRGAIDRMAAILLLESYLAASKA
ncbi:MAG: Holliday junction resolvase RuvX [Bryobacterales bacterium]|nr:Holliday junction resolvase RuvX [Bryobacterales bacterium]